MKNIFINFTFSLEILAIIYTLHLFLIKFSVYSAEIKYIPKYLTHSIYPTTYNNLESTNRLIEIAKLKNKIRSCNNKNNSEDNTLITNSGEQNGEKILEKRDEFASYLPFSWLNNGSKEKSSEENLKNLPSKAGESSENDMWSWYLLGDLLGSTSESKDETSSLAPYSLLKFISSMNGDNDSLFSLVDLYYSDPENQSYMSRITLLLRVALFFTPGAGIFEQIYFALAVSKIMWKATIMYSEGQDSMSIVISIAPDVLKIMLSRREVFQLTPEIEELKSGDTINIESMDMKTFLTYVEHFKYPPLLEQQENEIKNDVTNLVTDTFPNVPATRREELIRSLMSTMKFLIFVNVEGEIHLPDSIEVVDLNEIFAKKPESLSTTLSKFVKSVFGY